MKELRGAGAGSHLSNIMRPDNLSGSDGDALCTCNDKVCFCDGRCSCENLAAWDRSRLFHTKEVYKYHLSALRFDEQLEAQYRHRLAERLPRP